MGLSSTLEGIVLGQKYNGDKHKISVVKRDGSMFISSKLGTIIATSINGKMRLQDNGNINSWNTNLSDHIKSFKNGIVNMVGSTQQIIKDRIICFGDIGGQKRPGTYVYPTISVDKLNELYLKGYRYFITTLEEHLMDEVLDWIRGYPETKWIHMKIKNNVSLPNNSISYDHRWYILDILEKELPGKCSIINRTEEQRSDKPVVLCNFETEEQWKRLEYKEGYYYWSINQDNIGYHHNSIRVFTGTSTLIDDAIHVFQYYSTHQHKPENTPLGKYHVDEKNQRRFEIFIKYVVHNGQEINNYLLHCPYTK